MHSSKLFRPSCPSDPRPQEKTCPLSFRARVWDSPHDTATMICASRATTCSNRRQRPAFTWLTICYHTPIKTWKNTNLVSFWISRVPAVLGHYSHRCTLSHPPAGRLCFCGHTPHHALACRERIHIFVAQPLSLHQSHPNLAVRRKHFPSTALWSKLALPLGYTRQQPLGKWKTHLGYNGALSDTHTLCCMTHFSRYHLAR